MKKRASKRRIKARMALGKWITKKELVEHRLSISGDYEVKVLSGTYRLRLWHKEVPQPTLSICSEEALLLLSPDPPMTED